MHGFGAVAEALIAADARTVRACDLMSNTPLHAAAFSGHKTIVEHLLKARAQVNAADIAGNTPLHRATLEGNFAVAKVLIDAGADANACGSERNTPLHYVSLCAAEQPAALAELLIQGGADKCAKNRFGKTAHDLAMFQARPSP